MSFESDSDKFLNYKTYYFFQLEILISMQVFKNVYKNVFKVIIVSVT